MEKVSIRETDTCLEFDVIWPKIRSGTDDSGHALNHKHNLRHVGEVDVALLKSISHRSEQL